MAKGRRGDAKAWPGSRLHLPRSVRMRLALLSAGVILVSGGVLLAFAFSFGGNARITQVRVAGTALAGGPFGVPDFGGPIVAFSAGPTGADSGVVTVGGATSIAEVSRNAAQFGSAIALHHLLYWAVLGLLIVTLLGFTIGWRFAGRILRPLRTMRETTQRISEKNLHERLALAGPPGDELKDLGDTIDGLLGRLEAAFDAQRRFVQNASHELRTPITMMRTSVEVATGKPGGVPPEVRALSAKLVEGLDHAERLLEGFLALARAQGASRSNGAEVPLHEVAAAALQAREEEIGALGLTVERGLGEACARGSATLLPQVVTNLVDNGIRHNLWGGTLRVTTRSDGPVLRIVVENSGEVLEQARVDELGQPFHRLVDRTRSDRGAGLGLSIVTAILESEGGTMRLEARQGGGLRATVELPAAPARRVDP